VNPLYRLLEGPYTREVLEQPEALWDTAQSLREQGVQDLAGRFRHGAFDRIVLTGMGSSYHVLHSIAARLSGTGVPTLVLETSELVHVHHASLSARSLLVIVSQSGQSAETIRLLDRIPPGCRTIGITNTPGSPLAVKSAPVLFTQAGPETSVTCKTYLASVCALLWLAEVLDGGQAGATADGLAVVADAVADYLSWWRDHVEDLADVLSATERVFILGRGPSLAAAGAAGLMLKEAARFPAEAMSSAAFRHGPIEMIGPGTAVFVLEGPAALADLSRQLVLDLESAGTRPLVVDRHAALPALKLPQVQDYQLPLVEILPFHMVALALAALAGREAGRFERAQKITRTD